MEVSKRIFAGAVGAIIVIVAFYIIGYLDFSESKFSAWTEPSVLATLLGGLGGALAGTLISGYSASNLWRKQEVQREQEKQRQEMKKRKIFNSMIYAELKDIEVHTIGLILDLTINDELFENVYTNEALITELFYKHLDDIPYCTMLIENAYREAKSYSYSDVVDYDILGKIANVRVRTNRLFIEHSKYEHELYTRLKSLDRPNSTIHKEIVLKTMIGLNLCRKLIIDLNEFFKANEKVN